MRSATLAAALLALSIVSAQGQEAATPASNSPAVAAPAGRNVIRLDLAAVLFSNLDNNFGRYNGMMLPLMLSAERQLKGRTSLVGEALLGGGSSFERRWGLGVQGRYYFLRRKEALTGLYVAPVLSLRSASTDYRVANFFGGAGLMLGAQLPLACKRRLLLDASAGVMAWQLLSNGQEARRRQEAGYEPLTNYGLHPVLPDVRLGLGWRF